MRHAWWFAAVAVAVVGCGPSTGGDGSSTEASHGSSTLESTGPSSSTNTASDVTTSEPELTTGATEAGTTEDAPVDCSPAPPIEVPAPPPGCEHVYQQDVNRDPDPTRPSGLWRCQEGTLGIFRAAAIACTCEHFASPCPTGNVDACGNFGACAPGESCVAPYGDSCLCQAQCNADADCSDDTACLCVSSISMGEPWFYQDFNQCLPADCRTDQDCGGSLRCRLSVGPCWEAESFHCDTPADACTNDDDCLEIPNGYCRWNEAEVRWTCQEHASCE